MGSFDVNSFTNSFMQWYGIGNQIGARYDLNKMRDQQPSPVYTSYNPTAGGMGGVTGQNYLGQQFGPEGPSPQQMLLAQQQQRANIFESRGLFDDARMARQNLGTMQNQDLQRQQIELDISEKKAIANANQMLAKARNGDVDALSEALKMGAKYVTDDNTPMTVNLSDDGKSAIFQIGSGQPVEKKLSELNRREITAITNRLQPGVLAAASPKYASLFAQDQRAQERFGLSVAQHKQAVADAEKRFNEQVRQFNSTDQRARDQAKAQQQQWAKQNSLSDFRLDLQEEAFQHGREMDLAKFQQNQKLIDARIKELQKKLRPAEWQHNWSVIQNPNSTHMEFALAAGIPVDMLGDTNVLAAIDAYQQSLQKIPMPNNMPNRQPGLWEGLWQGLSGQQQQQPFGLQQQLFSPRLYPNTG